MFGKDEPPRSWLKARTANYRTRIFVFLAVLIIALVVYTWASDNKPTPATPEGNYSNIMVNVLALLILATIGYVIYEIASKKHKSEGRGS